MAKRKHEGWFAMAANDGSGYFGILWANNGSGGFHKPRCAMIPSLNVSMPSVLSICSGEKECRIAARMAKEVVGVKCRPVPVDFRGSGKDAKVVLKR